MLLNRNEENVLDLIKQNPFLSQQEIADRLNINRSTVATVISSLISKRQLVGRAYVLNDTPAIVCIGGMNIDRKYRMLGPLVNKTSNPVSSQMSVGGVSRNIAENLGRLGHNVHLLSLAGYDQDYEWIKQKTASHVNMHSIQQKEDFHTSSYTAILDDQGEMQLALADMAICDQMDLKWLESHRSLLMSAQAIILDLNLPIESVTYIIDFAREFDIALYIVPVSGPKMVHLPKQLEGADCIIVNQDESETYFNLPLDSQEDLSVLATQWLGTGVKQVIITRGSRSIFYANQEGNRQEFLPPLADQVVDVTGAGDSFVAGFVHGQIEDKDYLKSIHLALTNSYHTVQSTETVRLELSAPKLQEEYKELKERGYFHA